MYKSNIDGKIGRNHFIILPIIENVCDRGPPDLHRQLLCTITTQPARTDAATRRERLLLLFPWGVVEIPVDWVLRLFPQLLLNKIK